MKTHMAHYDRAATWCGKKIKPGITAFDFPLPKKHKDPTCLTCLKKLKS